jgi:ribosomal protein S18 acetylase RimI-like enzyme
MKAAERPAPVIMVRDNLEGIPEFAMPAGYSLRWYQPGDEENWFLIQAAADQFNEITRELFQRQFGSDQRLLAMRQCYLVDAQGKAIGTGSAWFNDNFEGEKFGRVHWVAVAPEYQRRGLGKAILTAVCRALRELGHERAYLTTETVRLRAIGLYLKFGFVPLIRSELEQELWQGVSHELATRQSGRGQPHSKTLRK